MAQIELDFRPEFEYFRQAQLSKPEILQGITVQVAADAGACAGAGVPFPARPTTQESQRQNASAVVRGLLSVKAPACPAGGERTPVDLCLVIDRSGSMGGAPIMMVKAAAEYILSQLKPGDRLSLVTYDDTAQTVFGLEHCTPQSVATMVSLIRSVQVRGSTNLCEGLLAGLRQHAVAAGLETNLPADHNPHVGVAGTGVGAQTLGSQSHSQPARVRVRALWLLTDGLANQGITSHEGIVQKMSQALEYVNRHSPRERFAPLTVHTFGFSPGHDPDLLSRIARSGGGDFLYIEGEGAQANIGTSFGTALGGLLSTAAVDVHLRVRLPRGACSGQVDVPAALKDQFAVLWNPAISELSLRLGDMFAEERRDVPLIFATTGSITTTHCHLASVQLDYQDLLGLQQQRRVGLEIRITLNLDPSAAQPKRDREVAMHLLRFGCLATMAKARGLLRGPSTGIFGGAGTGVETQQNLERAREMLQGRIAQLEKFGREEQQLLGSHNAREAAQKRLGLVKGLLDDLRNCLQDMASQQQFESVGSKKMQWMGSAYGKQRALGGASSAQNALFGSALQQSSAAEAQMCSMSAVAQQQQPPQQQRQPQQHQQLSQQMQQQPQKQQPHQSQLRSPLEGQQSQWHQLQQLQQMQQMQLMQQQKSPFQEQQQSASGWVMVGPRK